jgi:hypothetical protein
MNLSALNAKEAKEAKEAKQQDNSYNKLLSKNHQNYYKTLLSFQTLKNIKFQKITTTA